MKYKEFKMKHDNLEREVLDFLRTLIKESKITSETVNTPCIKVNVFDYVELAVIHGDLTFLDNDGLQYGLYTECALEDLIDIISKI